MLNDNWKIDYRNRFSFSCLYYRFSKWVASMERLLALLMIKLKPLTSVDTSRSAPYVVCGGLATYWLAGRSVWLQILFYAFAGQDVCSPPHRRRVSALSKSGWSCASLPPVSPRSQSREEMWLTGEKYDWLATWSRLEKAKWLTADLSQYDWRRRRYGDFSQHRRHLQHSPDLLAGSDGMGKGKEKEERGKKTKGRVNGG